jgi:transporter family-2 protein
MSWFAVLALVAGACIAVQASMNALLGEVLGSSLKATSYAFFTSFILVSLLALIQWQAVPNNTLPRVPWYLWFSCVFSVLGVASFYYLIPKMGVGNMMSYALTGQIIFAMLISHFGLFYSPIKVIDLSKLLGMVLLIAGIILINKE